MACTLITLNTAIGGVTYPFFSCYKVGAATVTYTVSNAGGTGPGCSYEGWTYSGTCDYSYSNPEIFIYDGSTVYSFDPASYAYPSFVSFVNGLNGLGGMVFYDSYYDVTQTFLPCDDCPVEAAKKDAALPLRTTVSVIPFGARSYRL